MEDELGNIYRLYQSVAPLADLSVGKANEILEALKITTNQIHGQIQSFHVPFAEHNSGLLISRYQRSLYMLANSIWKEIEDLNSSQVAPSQLSQQFLKKFSDELIQLIGEIKKFFPDEFDSLYPAPLDYLHKGAAQLNQKLNRLRPPASTAEEKELLSILNTAVSYNSLKSMKAGLFHLEFLEDLIAAMTGIIDASDDKIHRWTNMMIEFGFNSPAFYSYCCMEIIKKRDDCKDMMESYGELYWIKKRLQQLVLWRGVPFHSTLPGIKSSLLNFVEAEIAHLQSLEKIGGELAGHGQLNENFRVSFSVKELAYFIHLQVECGIILEEKPKRIHQYVIGHYSTQETDKISEKSFKNASYSRLPNNVSKVITKLSQMLARAQDDL